MGVPQVSPQALMNEAERHKSWESLEKCLVGLISTGQVLDYQVEKDFIAVTLNGTNRPVRIPVRPPAENAVPAESFEAAPETKGGGTATAVKPAKAAKKAPARPVATVSAPVGVVALVGLKTESYEHHARRIADFFMSFPASVPVESRLQDWYRSLK